MSVSHVDENNLANFALEGHREIIQMHVNIRASSKIAAKSSSTEEDIDNTAKDKNATALAFDVYKDHKELVGMLQQVELETKRTKGAPEVFALLQTVSFTKYLDLLLRCEYMTILDLKDASSNDLKECGLPPRVRNILLHAVLAFDIDKE